MTSSTGGGLGRPATGHALLGEPCPQLRARARGRRRPRRGPRPRCRRRPAARRATAAKSRCSSVSSNLIAAPLRLAGQAEDALGDDVALDLVGAGVDRAGQREEVAVGPARLDLGLGPEQVERGLVQRDVELGPEDLVDRAGRAHVAAVGQPGDRAPGVEPVGLCLDPGVDDVGRAAVASGPRSRPVEVDQPVGGGAEPAGGAQRQAALVAGRAHRDPPAVARRAEHVGVGHEHVLEEDLGEARPRRRAGRSAGR